MTIYLPRSAWTTTSRGGSTLTGSKLLGVSVHYPAAGNVTYANLTREQVIRRLQGWWHYHVNTRGWSDIGYQVAIDGKGRVWDLRGIDRVPAASASTANPDANHEWGACLFIVGNNERPTAAAIEAFVHWRNTFWLRRWPAATRVLGHGQVPGAQTACPGSHLRALIADGTLTTKEDDDMLSADEIAEAVVKQPIPISKDETRPLQLVQRWAWAQSKRGRLAAEAALAQANRNADALEEISRHLEGIAPGVAQAVVDKLGDRLTVTLSFDSDEEGA